MKKKLKNKLNTSSIFLISILVFIFAFSVIQANENLNIAETSSSGIISNKKIGWGIKRTDNHEQPDVGAVNKSIIEKYKGICMGNAEKKYIYLTFDNGYEAGYTEKILEVLKQNEVPATFFLTAHYINTQPELVQRMIDEGHIIGNHTPISLMSGNIV